MGAGWLGGMARPLRIEYPGACYRVTYRARCRRGVCTPPRRPGPRRGSRPPAPLGRFLNRDPIEEAGGLNLYAFCGNDGVNGFDLLGMDGEDDKPRPPPSSTEKDVIQLPPIVVTGTATPFGDPVENYQNDITGRELNASRNGPNNATSTHTVTVQSYIGASSTGPFLGDGRGASASPSDAYRTSSTITFDPTNPSGSGTVTSTTGVTVAIVPGPNGPIVRTGHASSSGLTGSSTYVSPGIVRVNLNGSAANPLVPGAPPITYNTSISINFNNGTYAGSLTRTDFPSFQIFVDGKPIYSSTEVGTPTNLYNSTFVPIKGTLPDPTK
jgi:hypothetical protein